MTHFYIILSSFKNKLNKKQIDTYILGTSPHILVKNYGINHKHKYNVLNKIILFYIHIYLAYFFK